MDDLSPNPNKPVPPKYRSSETKIHRFVPTEKPRVVVEHSTVAPAKIAGGVGFNPVATVALPDKTVFVRPVKNTHTRPVSPGVVAEGGKLKVTGTKTIEISDNLHSQLKAKVTSTMNTLVPPKSKTEVANTAPYVTSSNLQPLVKPVLQAEPQENQLRIQARNEVLKNQLETLNKTLFEQIKKRISEEITKQNTVPKPTAPQTAPEIVKTETPVSKPNSEAKFIPSQSINRPAPTEPASQPSREHLRSLIESKPVAESVVSKEPIQPEASQVVKPKPLTIQASTPTTPSLERPSIATTKPDVQQKQPLPNLPSVTDYKSHINKLESEIGLLNKEVNYMDRTVADLEKERNLHELSTIEKKIEVDRQMLQAVSDWRVALNNLINSHTIALKYLKQKTDWLESQVDRLSGHRDKHDKDHHKPKPIEIKMSPLPSLPQTKPVESPTQIIDVNLKPSTISQQHSKSEAIKSIDVSTNLKVASIQPSTGPASEKPITVQANLITRELQPGETTNTPGPTVIKEVQTTSFEAVKNLVQEALRREQPNIKPSEETLKTLVDKTLENKELVGKADASDIQKAVENTLKTQTNLIREGIQKELPSIQPSQDSVREALSQTLKETPNLVKPSVEEIKSIIKEELKDQRPQELQTIKPSEPSKEDLESIVKEIISEGNVGVKPTQVSLNLSKDGSVPLPVTPPVSGSVQPIVNVTISQAEIEKQILDQAVKEDSEREARETAKREEARKKAEEQALAKLAEVKSSQQPTRNPENNLPTQPTSTEPVVSEAALKESFGKLKSDLTTIDPQKLASLPGEKRTELLQKLQNLETESVVSRQFDEIKAAAERRRINNELQSLLSASESKPITTTAQTETANQPVQQKIETLKIEQRNQRSPEEKAKVISEIKDLEREAQARKAATVARPVIKAQPAYGKMLPNTPTVPNIINGIVKDAKGLLLPTVVIIVKDLTGEPVRALKTNKIGQFALSTAVPNGTYTLELEKEGYDFDIMEVDVNGTIMQPIEVKSK